MSEQYIRVFDFAGNFAENKDKAKEVRETVILPTLNAGGKVVFDYEGVGSTTQSFTHALISEAIRTHGADVLDEISFKNCSEDVKRIISIVVEYMQGNMESPIPQE